MKKLLVLAFVLVGTLFLNAEDKNAEDRLFKEIEGTYERVVSSNEVYSVSIYETNIGTEKSTNKFIVFTETVGGDISNILIYEISKIEKGMINCSYVFYFEKDTLIKLFTPVKGVMNEIFGNTDRKNAWISLFFDMLKGNPVDMNKVKKVGLQETLNMMSFFRGEFGNSLIELYFNIDVKELSLKKIGEGCYFGKGSYLGYEFIDKNTLSISGKKYTRIGVSPNAKNNLNENNKSYNTPAENLSYGAIIGMYSTQYGFYNEMFGLMLSSNRNEMKKLAEKNKEKMPEDVYKLLIQVIEKVDLLNGK